MQAIINHYQSFKKAIVFVILIACGQSLLAQSGAVSGMPEKHSTSVNRNVTTDNFPSFDAIVTTDSSDSKVILTVENPGKAKLQIRVYHAYYGELFRKETKEEIYRNRFDLGNAEDGSYYIEISTGKEKIRKQVQINTITQINRKIAIS